TRIDWEIRYDAGPAEKARHAAASENARPGAGATRPTGLAPDLPGLRGVRRRVFVRRGLEPAAARPAHQEPGDHRRAGRHGAVARPGAEHPHGAEQRRHAAGGRRDAAAHCALRGLSGLLGGTDAGAEGVSRGGRRGVSFAATRGGAVAQASANPYVFLRPGAGKGWFMDLAAYIRDIPGFPKPGILFKDITPLLAETRAYPEAIELLCGHYRARRVDAVAAAEARGFLFAAPMALRMNLPLVPLRKPGKLPYRTHALQYDLEYGSAELHVHIDSIAHGSHVLLVDDLLATGGTLHAGCQLIEKAGGVVAGCGGAGGMGVLRG